ncbi:hypothetical protein LCGC14_0480890 [marine sediment metagenome]|uniref:Transcriptional regulator n=1 Tax=marine sediment metagenome TaxID=412755 RepID=A0A0F9S9B2_9ZZZZ
MTDKTTKALQIIRDNHLYGPAAFARLMWPDSEGWQRVHNCGRGASRGVMMAYAAGGYLGKLRARGLIIIWYSPRGIHLTDKGKALLRGSGGDGENAGVSTSERGKP